MADMNEKELQDSLTLVYSKLESLDKERKLIKKLSMLIALFVLVPVLIFILYSVGLTKKIDAEQVISLATNSPQVRQAFVDNMQKINTKLVPSIKQEVIKTFLQDPKYISSIEEQLNLFVKSVDATLTAQLPVLYADLVNKQISYIYKTLPEFKNKPLVEKSIDNIIKIGGPKIYIAFTSRFNEHKQSLIKIYHLVSSLKDESMRKFPSLEKAVLGITLELFGKILRENGEKGENKHE